VGGAGLLGGAETVVARSGAFNIPDRPEELDGRPEVSVSVLDGGPGAAGAGLFLGCAARPAAPGHPGKAHRRTRAVGRGIICSPEGAGAVGATPLSAAPDLVTSCSATDWPVELAGGPGGSDAAVDRWAGSESGSDAESSDLVGTLLILRTWWETISRSKLARSREMRRLTRSRDARE
jgi:hypothetical protein